MKEIIPYGDTAMLINLEQIISPEVHSQVVKLKTVFEDVAGVISLIPAYASLTVVFDPAMATFSDLSDVAESVDLSEANIIEYQGRQIEIPVCYEAEFALDLANLSVQTGRSAEEVVDVHSSTSFYVYMIGFMPGFAYMGDMPEEFSCHRRPVPRTRVPAGSVGLAGRQTAVYPFDSPGGWQIIGRTPLVMFEPGKPEPGVLRGGDFVTFQRISKTQFDEMYGGTAQELIGGV